MSMFSLFRPLLLLFFFLGASNSYAGSDYYQINGSPDLYFDSIASACADQTAISTYVSLYMEGWEYISPNTTLYGGNKTQCSFNGKRTSTGIEYQAVSGPSPTLIGSCTSKSGTTGSFSWPIGREETAIGDPSFQSFGDNLPATMCLGGCELSGPFSAVDDPFSGTADPDNPGYEIIYADIQGSYSGSSCNSTSNESPVIPALPEPEPDPCVADPASCEPDLGGGDTGGGDTGGGDTGGGDTGGGDTGGGSTGGGSTSPTPGPGTDPQEPGAGGEGTTSVASGMACDQPTICTGDAIQCAILSQQKAQRCLDAENSDYEAQKGAIDSLVQGEEFELDQSEVEAPSLFDQHGRFLTASCPPPESFALSFGSGHSFQFSYEPLCRIASDLSWLIVAFATLASALYIGRSFGGD